MASLRPYFRNTKANQQVDFLKHGALIQPFIPDGE